MQELGDSLTIWTGFSRVWSPVVRVKQMRINGNEVTIRTNATLHDVRWTPQNLADIKRKVSRWTLGHENGNITIYSGKTDVSTLITDCARGAIPTSSRCSSGKCLDLTDHTIALWPSHGLYHNAARDEWIWQRATLWTTVEDLYSQEYVRLLRQMLENAGASVVMPRAGIEHQEQGQSGMPRWTEAARYWLIEQGADSTIWDIYDGNEYKDDMKSRPLWVNSLETPPDLCLAFHTDGLDSGDDSTIVGTLCIYTACDDDGHPTLRDGRDREKTNRNLADWIQTQVTKDLRHIAPEWTRRQLKEANYCESRVPVVPSVLVELLSHKNMADMRYGLNPQFRFTAARALYKGILRYLNGQYAIIQPLPVEDLGIQISNHQSATCTLQWKPVTDSIESSANPTYYMVYVQMDEGEWDVLQTENVTHLEIELKRGVKYNFYVVAGNDGGLSMPSPVISAYLHPISREALNGEIASSEQIALILDAFDDSYGPEWFADSLYAGIVPGSYACEDRFSCAYIGEQWDYTRAHPWINDDNCGWGACYRDHAGQLTIGNTRDWSALHGRVLREMGISYLSCTAGMLPEYQMATHCPFIDCVCGRQRQPLSDETRAFIASYLDNGGRLLLSSDHISAIDPTWAKRYLHASYYAAHATHNGKVRLDAMRPFTIALTPNDEHLCSPMPEGLKAEGKDATSFATYMDMRCPAAIKWQTANNASQKSKTLVFGFPLEAVDDFSKIYRHAVKWLIEL